MSLEETRPRIKLGDYIIIQRQQYARLQKFSNLTDSVKYGRDQLELRNLLDHPYGSTFKMCPKETQTTKNKRALKIFTLESCTVVEMRNLREVLGISTSGEDNRNIQDNCNSQALGAEEIAKLREELNDSTKIIEKIVENSKTFHSKTEYAQEKYLKKKEKKYFEFVQIRKPSIRLMTDIFYKISPDKIMGLRMDSLSQIISYASICAYGNHLLYESGTSGLLPALYISSIGANTEAKIVHTSRSNMPQRQAVAALNFPDEQLNRYVFVNIYSVLRTFYQKKEEYIDTNNESVSENEPCSKKQKLDDEEIETTSKESNTESAQSSLEPRNVPKWMIENRKACKIMLEKFDSLVVVAKEHPSGVLKALLPFIKPSRPIIVFSLCKELLLQLFWELKNTGKVTKLHITSNWLRTYQILPNRTHPEVNMSGNSGYILRGVTIS